MGDSKQHEGLLDKQLTRRQVLAGGAAAAGAAAFMAVSGSSVRAQAAADSSDFGDVELNVFSGGFSIPAQEIALQHWQAAGGGNAIFDNVPFNEKPAKLAGIIATQDSGWDVIYTYDVYMQRFAHRLLEPVADYYTGDIEDFYPAARETFSSGIDGVLRGLPTHYSGFFTGVNMDHFNAIGVDEVPTTWEELINLTPKFKEKGIIPSIQPWQGTPNIFAAFYFMQIYNSLGHPMFSGDRTALMFDGDEGLRTFELIEKGIKDGFWSAEHMNVANEHDTFVLFDTSDGSGPALIIQGQDNFPGRNLEPGQGLPLESYRRMINPGIDPGTTGTVNGADGLGISKFSGQADAAKSFFNTMYSPEVAREIALSPNQYAATRFSVIEDPEVQAYDAEFIPLWEGQNTGVMNRWGAPYDWNPVFDEVLSRMISEGLSGAEAQKQAVEGTQEIIVEWLLA